MAKIGKVSKADGSRYTAEEKAKARKSLRSAKNLLKDEDYPTYFGQAGETLKVSGKDVVEEVNAYKKMTKAPIKRATNAQKRAADVSGAAKQKSVSKTLKKALENADW